MTQNAEVPPLAAPGRNLAFFLGGSLFGKVSTAASRIGSSAVGAALSRSRLLFLFRDLTSKITSRHEAMRIIAVTSRRGNVPSFIKLPAGKRGCECRNSYLGTGEAAGVQRFWLHFESRHWGSQPGDGEFLWISPALCGSVCLVRESRRPFEIG